MLLTFIIWLYYNVHIGTSSKNISAKRIALLAATEQKLFHTNDLALLLTIESANTLRVTLHRLTRAGILHRIQRGLYSILPPEKIDPILIGSAVLHRSSYLTTESVLRDEGYILQSIDVITFASGVSRKFAVMGHRTISRRLHPRFLQNMSGIRRSGGVLRADPDRAIADMLYFDPWYHFDKPVDWDRVSALQKEIGYPLTSHRYADSQFS